MSEFLTVAQAGDAEDLSWFVNTAYRGESSKRGWTTEADLLGGQRTDPDMLRDLISEKNNTILLMRADADLIGSVFLQRKAESAYLGMLTVRPHLQARGIGRRLLTMAEDWVRNNWRLHVIEMTVIQQRLELIAWYERRGYVNTLRTEPFPYGNEKFGLPKQPDLKFAVLEKRL
ncbi:MAG: GNAT family N-acetyltransferase [Rhodomicrobium sp.]